MLDQYHMILIYPGETNMIETIKLVFTLSGLNKQVTNAKCVNEQGRTKYELLLPKNAKSMR